MTVYAANALVHAVLMNNPAVSTDLRVGRGEAQFFYRPLLPSAFMSTGAIVKNEPISIEHVSAGPIAGGAALGPGDYIFERIHVLPSLRSIPFILSSQHVLVEVWNAFRTLPQTAATVTAVGPDGVTIAAGGLAGVVFAPMESKIYDILINAIGAPRADNSVVFDFGPTPSPFFYTSGLRLLPFTISPDWDTGIDETVEYMTDVMIAYDTTEQRMQLREIPSRTIKFHAMALDPKENSLMLALLYSWQGRSYGVPLWMRGAPLGFTIGAGEQDIIVDTTFMEIVVGSVIILITDAFEWFASTVESMTAGSIHLASPTDRAFVATRASVVPIVLGRIADSVQVSRPTNASAVMDISFDIEVVEAVDSTSEVLV